jgi:hypothetical protein
MVGATARAQLADALEAALEARKRGFARGAQQWISNEKQEKGV